ncbi:MAG TPA: alpha/beta hydrolase [Acidimicrobiales bacterium]|nr:alpha/beta hydrolase [Acidimicrobiales bacterium]
MGSVVLIHGAMHGAWCWEGVVTELEARGIKVYTPELPFTGMSDDVAAAQRAIEDADDQVVVCGHSYGGMVMSAAARELTQVTRLVYLAALMTDVGETLDVLFRDHPPGAALNVQERDGKLFFDLEELHSFFYGDSELSAISAIAPRLRPMAPENWTLDSPPAWKTIPSTYVICSNDRAIPPSLQRLLATRAGEVVEWPTDHSPFLTRPDQLATLLAGYAAEP